jgi:hypothetical protein
VPSPLCSFNAHPLVRLERKPPFRIISYLFKGSMEVEAIPFNAFILDIARL